MNLLQIRQLFREISGRYDLVNEDGSDNGADFYINEGRKFLDRLDETQKSWGTYFFWLRPGLWGVQISHCRAIKEVWASTTEARWQLEKKRLQDMMAEYLNKTPSNRDSGIPLYYSPVVTRFIVEDSKASQLESFVGYVDIPSGNAHAYNALVVAPPSNTLTSLEVVGLFYSHPLLKDEDENYWTVMHPNLLIMAAMRQLEIVNRNTQGVNDWSAAIMAEVTQLGFDLVEEMIAEVDTMEG